MSLTPILVFFAKVLKPPFHLKNWKWFRLFVLATVDMLVVCGAYWLSYFLRLEELDLGRYQSVFLKSLPIVLGVHLVVFYWGGMYRQVWRFANAHSAILILRCVLYATLISTACVYFFLEKAPPRSLAAIHFLLAGMFLGFEKFSWRAWAEFQKSLSLAPKPKCIIFGAGSAGELFSRHIGQNTKFPYHPVCFVDDDKNKRGRIIHGLKIEGDRHDLAALCSRYNAKHVILTMPSAPGRVIREIVNVCKQVPVRVLIMPEISHTLGSMIIQPRKIDIQDLLRRAPKSIDRELIYSFLSGKTVLVTGAGGSIGSEICRQVAACHPKALILVDSNEYNLFNIENELNKNFPDLNHHCVLQTVTDKRAIERLFTHFEPFCVLHAAAYKHVPIVEKNPSSGIVNNIMGTKILAESALKFDTKHFILISSDKAVNPANIMGSTKRCCELLVQALGAAHKDSTKFTSVRFGNVLGSSGSVIPEFMKQIQAGGPVTVTHPEINRFFMLTNEAVGLVLQAAAASGSEGGKVFVLNMGEPVKIYDMARQLIELAGKVPGKDIEISFTGLRPGEKLFEELILEGTEKTSLHEDIFILKPQPIDEESLLSKIDKIIDNALSGEEAMSVALVKNLAKYKAPDTQHSSPQDQQVLH